MLIERDSRFILWAESATIPPRGKNTAARRRSVEREEERFDRSRSSVRGTLKRGAKLAKRLSPVTIETNKQIAYVALAREVFGPRDVQLTTSSKLPRTKRNPLFPVNHTKAMARDLMGRMRRGSWLSSKRRRYLDLALQLFACHRNYVRRRFNRDRASRAQRLGFMSRRLSESEMISWRQERGQLSIHPLAGVSESIAGWRRAG